MCFVVYTVFGFPKLLKTLRHILKISVLTQIHCVTHLVHQVVFSIYIYQIFLDISTLIQKQDVKNHV